MLFDLRQHCRNYDILAKTYYGFKNIEYPVNLNTYAMDPETGTLYSMIPEVIPQIPHNYRIEFVRAGIAHESGHLINRNTLIKVIKIFKNKNHEIFKERNISFLKHIYNILVDVAHERSQAEKYPIDLSSFQIFWGHIEDNLWSLEKIKFEDENVQEEIEEINLLLRFIQLTERNIQPKRFSYPEKFLDKLEVINNNILNVVRNTYDGEKIFRVSVDLYDLLMEKSPNFKNELDSESKRKIKIYKVKGCPPEMELDEDFNMDELDDDDYDIEEIDFQDYVEKVLGKDFETFSKKCIKNKNSDNKDKDTDSSTKAFCQDNSSDSNVQEETVPPEHFGDKNKVVILDYDVVDYEKELYYDEYQVSKKEIRDFSKLESILRKKLIAKCQDKIFRNQIKGRLDDRKLAMVPLMKNMKVKPLFERKIMSQDITKTKITLLIDESGSMYTNRKYFHARSAAILFSEILSRIKIDFEVIGFSTVYNSKKPIHFPACVTRNDSLHHIIYKKFKEKLIKERLGGIKSRENNCDGESLIFAAMRLMSQNANRRIIFVFSDGYPNCSAEYNLQNDLIHAVEICQSNGIEVYGIGICSDAVQKFYKNWIIINDATNLTQEFYYKLNEVLLAR